MGLVNGVSHGWLQLLLLEVTVASPTLFNVVPLDHNVTGQTAEQQRHMRAVLRQHPAGLPSAP